MGKKALLPIVLMVIGIEVFSGCTSPPQTPLDGDGDGYPDTIDDFPDDITLFDAITIYDSNQVETDPAWTISSGETKFTTWWVTNDSRFIGVDVDAIRLLNGTALPVFPSEINISVETREAIYENNYGQFGRIMVTTRNWGEWRLSVTNRADFEVTAQVAIYLLK